MDLRFYIPLSKYLQPNDGQPTNAKEKDKFFFKISCQNSKAVIFGVYKSLASFLSSNAYQQLILKHNFLEIDYHYNQLSPQEVKDQLINVLSGKPIIVDQNNFQVFEEIFFLLGNRDFGLFFNHKIPESPTAFFLSIHSLKHTDRKLLESPFVIIHFTKTLILEVPFGILHLFFPDELKLSDPLPESLLNQNEIEDGIDFFYRFSKGSFSLPNDNHIQLLTCYKFHQEILSLYFNFFFPTVKMIHIPQKEFEKLENENNNLRNDLKQTIEKNKKKKWKQKIEFISQIEKEKTNLLHQKIENKKIELELKNQELIKQIAYDQKEWERQQQEFLNKIEIGDSHQKEIIRLRFLFLQHLSLHHSIKKEEKEIDYEFQSTLDEVFQNEDEYFETFFNYS
jgi:hypothetical protein